MKKEDESGRGGDRAPRTAYRIPHTAYRISRTAYATFAVKNDYCMDITISELLSVLKVPVLIWMEPFIEES